MNVSKYCDGITREGTGCRRPAMKGSDYCAAHDPGTQLLVGRPAKQQEKESCLVQAFKCPSCGVLTEL